MIKLNGIPIVPTIFSDKTSQVWKLPSGVFFSKSEVEWIFESESEFIHIAQLSELISPEISVLKLPYLPYARQDKQVSNHETFAGRTFIKLLNSLKFGKVQVFDPHSDLVCAIKNVETIWPVKEIYMTLGATEASLICYPDKGAVDRYSKLIDFPYFYASKVRNQETGLIESISLNLKDASNENILLVDDICDGGMTFKLVAEQIKKQFPNVNLHLYVSHGIFSKGIETLKESGIDRIFTKDGEVK